MNYENFLIEENGNITFVECWMDRCIDREDEYIPTYPYWNDAYTPNSWVDEGMDICNNEATSQTTDLCNTFKESGIKIDSVVLFDKDTKYKPDEETGWTVYSIDDFLNIDYEKENYEGYVYYGYSKIVFEKGTSKNDILKVLSLKF